MPGTKTIPRPRHEPQLAPPTPDTGWKVVLFNDDIHGFDQVVLAIQRAAGLSEEVAHMIAHEAHSSGSAVVKRGLDREEALIICGGLRHFTRSATTPGVDCDAVKDDAP